MGTKIKEWSKLTWSCGCGALNAGWLLNCGRCGASQKEERKKYKELYNIR